MSQVEEISKNEELSDNIMMPDDEVSPDEINYFQNMYTKIDLQNLGLDWNTKGNRACVRSGKQPIQFVVRRAKLRFHEIEQAIINGQRHERIIIKSDDIRFAKYIDTLLDILKSKIPNFVSYDVRESGIGYRSIIAKLPLNNEGLVSVNVYDENHKLVNEATEPELDLYDLEMKYENVQPRKVSLNIQIDCISLYKGKYNIFMSIKDIYLKPSISRM